MAFKVKDHAKVVVYNIGQLEKNKSNLKVYKPSAMKLMIVSIGRDNGIFQLGSLTFRGFIPTMIKSKGLLLSRFKEMLGQNESSANSILKPAIFVLIMIIGYTCFSILTK